MVLAYLAQTTKIALESILQPRYPPPVAVNPATGFGSPSTLRRADAAPDQPAFFCACCSCYGGCAWGAFVRAGFLESRSTNLRTAVTNRLVAIDAGSTTLGAQQ